MIEMEYHVEFKQIDRILQMIQQKTMITLILIKHIGVKFLILIFLVDRNKVLTLKTI